MPAILPGERAERSRNPGSRTARHKRLPESPAGSRPRFCSRCFRKSGRGFDGVCIAALAFVHKCERTRAMRGAAGAARSTRRSRPRIGGRRKGDVGDARSKQPAVSRCHDTHFTPTVGISRYDGLKPATPQKAAGRITEPAVWVPNASGAIPAATPRRIRTMSRPAYAQDCADCGPAGTNEANSVVAVLPSTMPPARSVIATAAASARGRYPE